MKVRGIDPTECSKNIGEIRKQVGHNDHVPVNIITANEEMLNPLKDIPAFKAIRDRIKPFERIEFENESYRK